MPLRGIAGGKQNVARPAAAQARGKASRGQRRGRAFAAAHAAQASAAAAARAPGSRAVGEEAGRAEKTGAGARWHEKG